MLSIRSLFLSRSTQNHHLLRHISRTSDQHHKTTKPDSRQPASSAKLNATSVSQQSATTTPTPTPVSDGRCYVWGLSETGALGMHKSLKKQSAKQAAFVQHPTRLQFGERHQVLDIAAGYGFTAFAVKREDGICFYGSGINTDGQLGYQHRDGHADRALELVVYPAPIKLPEPQAAAGDGGVQPKAVQIDHCSAGRAHLLALDSSSGRCYTLGNNAYGQCARPVIADEAYLLAGTVHTLDSVGAGLRIATVHAGQDHSLFVTQCGQVYACGWGADGQTGLGHYRSEAQPQRVGGAIESERIVRVAGGVDCALALSAGGELFGWGNSEYGQLQCVGDEQQICVPQRLEALSGCGRIVDMAAGGSACIALNENGDCFVWGYGLLGLGPNVDHLATPTQIPATLFGRNEFAPHSRVRRVFAGISHMAAITDTDDVYVWGRNKFGCLGLGHQKDQFFPMKAAVAAKVEKVSCGVDHTVAMCRAFI